MKLKKREDVIKALECCIVNTKVECDPCNHCPYNECKWCSDVLNKESLALIKELTEDVERVSQQCGNIIAECDERDAERLHQVGEYAEKVKELTKENERLNKLLEYCEDDGEYWEGKYNNAVNDTVHKMQKKLKEKIDRTLDVFDFNISECNAVRQVLRGVKDDIYQVAKKLTEGKSDV